MSAEKTKAIILKVLPYRESSAILYLFSENHGLIHGIAKGIRKKKSKQDFLERGFHVELIVYIKLHRELHTVSSVQVLDFFPSIRTSLIKSALRDAAFETTLAAITVPDFHPELYTFFIKFISYLDSSSEKKCHPFALWLFYHRFSQYMGFGLDLENCILCGSPLKQNAFLSMNMDGFGCGICRKNKQDSYSVSREVRSYLAHGKPKPERLHSMVSKKTLRKITWLLADYCRYHFDTQKEYKALVFLDEMAGW